MMTTRTISIVCSGRLVVVLSTATATATAIAVVMTRTSFRRRLKAAAAAPTMAPAALARRMRARPARPAPTPRVRLLSHAWYSSRGRLHLLRRWRHLKRRPGPPVVRKVHLKYSRRCSVREDASF